MAKYGTPPFFSPKIFFNKMTQNGLKWILNTTLKSMQFKIQNKVLPRPSENVTHQVESAAARLGGGGIVPFDSKHEDTVAST